MTGSLGFGLTLWAALGTRAWAEDPPSTPPVEPQAALLVQPLGPTIGAVMSLAGAKIVGTDAIGLDMGLLDLNLRGLWAPSGRLGAFVQVDYTSLSFVMRSSHLGIRGGPRFALGDGGLDGWALAPFAVAGPTWIRAGDNGLARWWVLGLGAEIGRTWTPGPLAIELGFGLYSAANVGYRAGLSSFEDGRPEPILPVKPVLNLGIGLAR